MSWDVIILNVPEGVKIDGDLADDVVKPLGSWEEVIQAVSTAFPGADLSDPGWIVVRGQGYSIELGIEEAEEIEVLTLFVRGGAEAIDCIERLCRAGGWRAFDTSAGDFIDFSSSDRDRGLKRWLAYRDQVLRTPERD